MVNFGLHLHEDLTEPQIVELLVLCDRLTDGNKISTVIKCVDTGRGGAILRRFAEHFTKSWVVARANHREMPPQEHFEQYQAPPVQNWVYAPCNEEYPSAQHIERTWRAMDIAKDRGYRLAVGNYGVGGLGMFYHTPDFHLFNPVLDRLTQGYHLLDVHDYGRYPPGLTGDQPWFMGSFQWFVLHCEKVGLDWRKINWYVGEFGLDAVDANENKPEDQKAPRGWRKYADQHASFADLQKWTGDQYIASARGVYEQWDNCIALVPFIYGGAQALPQWQDFDHLGAPILQNMMVTYNTGKAVDLPTEPEPPVDDTPPDDTPPVDPPVDNPPPPPVGDPDEWRTKLALVIGRVATDLSAQNELLADSMRTNQRLIKEFQGMLAVLIGTDDSKPA